MKPLRRFLPTPQAVQRSRWLRWMGPAVLHPRLWHLSRRGLALGIALGVFFGLLIPIAQIPLSVGAAVALRANVPGAVASTMVSNPLTFGPLYYAAWRIGKAILGEPVREGEQPQQAQAPVIAYNQNWFAAVGELLRGIGKPLLLGLVIMSSAVALLAYLAVSWAWILRVRFKRRRRLKRMH